jgi:deoxycytidylate deaminase
MKFLEGTERDKALGYIKKAAEVAKKATCKRLKCGAIIVKDDEIIGSGFNSPPGDLSSQNRCENSKSIYDKKVTDKTCCMHAEQRAMMDALRNNSDKLKGSRLYFIRLDSEGKISFAGQPYCTICSKMTLDLGISEFVLNHKEGICVYDKEEYNDLSFNYKS